MYYIIIKIKVILQSFQKRRGFYYWRRGGVVILEKGRGTNTGEGKGLYYWRRGGIVLL